MAEEKKTNQFKEKLGNAASEASYGMDGSIIDVTKKFFKGVIRLASMLNDARALRAADREAKREERDS